MAEGKAASVLLIIACTGVTTPCGTGCGRHLIHDERDESLDVGIIMLYFLVKNYNMEWI
jgi:hypothetical protein